MRLYHYSNKYTMLHVTVSKNTLSLSKTEKRYLNYVSNSALGLENRFICHEGTLFPNKRHKTLPQPYPFRLTIVLITNGLAQQGRFYFCDLPENTQYHNNNVDK